MDPPRSISMMTTSTIRIHASLTFSKKDARRLHITVSKKCADVLMQELRIKMQEEMMNVVNRTYYCSGARSGDFSQPFALTPTVIASGDSYVITMSR